MTVYRRYVLFWCASGRRDTELKKCYSKLQDTERYLASRTGGFSSTVDYDESHISKQQLVSMIVAALESDTVRIAEDVKEAENLIQELSNYELRRSESGHVSYGAMSGEAFDDLVTSLGLSLFSAVTWGSSSQALFW